MKVLDQKLSNVAAFSGVALSIGGALGSSVVVSGALSPGYTIALGSVLATALAFLLAGALSAFNGLSPKDYVGISIPTAQARSKRGRLREDPAEAIAKLAATYYLEILPKARETNKLKVTAVRRSFLLVGLGLGGLVLTLILCTVAAVV